MYLFYLLGGAGCTRCVHVISLLCGSGKYGQLRFCRWLELRYSGCILGYLEKVTLLVRVTMSGLGTTSYGFVGLSLMLLCDLALTLANDPVGFCFL